MQNMNPMGRGNDLKKRKRGTAPLVLSVKDKIGVQRQCVCVCVCVCVWAYMCVCEKPGPCIEHRQPVGTMDATTPTPSPQPTSQRAFIWACTWVLQPCLAKCVCAPEQGGWVPSLNSTRALAANPPTFLRQQQPTRIRDKCAPNFLIFATKKKKEQERNLSTRAGTYFKLSNYTTQQRCQRAGRTILKSR